MRGQNVKAYLIFTLRGFCKVHKYLVHKLRHSLEREGMKFLKLRLVLKLRYLQT